MRRVFLIVATLVAAIPALAHSWYPLACCGQMDCFLIACDQLVETGYGWLYIPTGNQFKIEKASSETPKTRSTLAPASAATTRMTSTASAALVASASRVARVWPASICANMVPQIRGFTKDRTVTMA